MFEFTAASIYRNGQGAGKSPFEARPPGLEFDVEFVVNDGGAVGFGLFDRD